jgi:hypothetical protein
MFDNRADDRPRARSARRAVTEYPVQNVEVLTAYVRQPDTGEGQGVRERANIERRHTLRPQASLLPVDLGAR